MEKKATQLKEFAEGNTTFKKTFFKKHEKELIELSKMGQQPKALFIGCADSRVVPNLVTQAKPGDLFVIRNIGNFVPQYSENECFNSTSAGIEYAVTVLNVSEIIICGHTHCGAIEHLYQDVSPTAHIQKWLALGKQAKNMALISQPKNVSKEELLRVTEKLSIISQIEHLMSYPCVKAKIDAEELFIHGWYYDISDGNIDYYDPDEGTFKSLSELDEDDNDVKRI